MSTYKIQEQFRTAAATSAADKVFLSNPPKEQKSVEVVFAEIVANHGKTLEHLAK